MTLSLREVARDESATISTLFATSFTDTFGHLYAPEDLAVFMAQATPEAFAREMADPAFRFQLATVGGKHAGFAKVGPPGLPCWTPTATRELRQLYVLTPFLGSGAGAGLMDWVIANARTGGARHLQLSVFVDNQRARRFYARRGFAEVGLYKFMVGNHADEDIIMRADL